MLLNEMTYLRISVSSLRWLALVIYCLSLTIPQDGGRYIAIATYTVPGLNMVHLLVFVQNAGMKCPQMEK